MNISSTAKSGAKPGFLAFLTAVLIILPMLATGLYQQLKTITYTSAVSLTELVWITEPLTRMSIQLHAIWVILLVLEHYSKDRTVFDDTLVHANKKIILRKGLAAFFISLAVSLGYLAVFIFFYLRYNWLFNTMYWCMRQHSVDAFDLRFMVLLSVTVFVFCLALYWYCALCCCVSHSAASGLVLAVLGAAVFFTLIGLLSFYGYDISILNSFRALLKNTILADYALCTLVLALSALVLVISAPFAVLLYGGGKSKNPFFRYTGASIAAVLFFALSCAFYAPTRIYSPDVNIPLVMVLSGAAGLVVGIIAIKLTSKKKSKTEGEEK